MSTLMQVYCAIPVPMAAIGLFVGIYLHTLPVEADSYDVDDYAEPRRPIETCGPCDAAERSAKRRLRTCPEPTQRPEILPPAPAGADAGTPMYVALMARQWLREIGEQARQSWTVQREAVR
jgi:hypothetical protein